MKLRVLHDEIDERVRAVIEGAKGAAALEGAKGAAGIQGQAEWPCRRGCDDCCRSLAEPPRITGEEWALLADALDALDARDPARRRALAEAFEERLSGRSLRVCPLLEGGACSVYAARPIACRTYGFYDARDGGRWCARIEERDRSGLVLGNHDVLDQRLHATAGEGRSVLDWYRERFGV